MLPIALALSPATAFGVQRWERVWATSRNDVPGGICQTPDSGYIVAGTHGELMWAIRLSPAGDLEWSRAYGDYPRYYTGYQDLLQLGHGTCLLLANLLNLNGPESSCAGLVRIDEMGETLLTRHLDIKGCRSVLPRCVEQAWDGGFMIIGTCDYKDTGALFFMHTDTSGHVLQLRFLQGGYGTIYGAGRCADCGFIVLGQSIYVWLMRLGSTASELWFHYEGGISGGDVCELPGGDYAMCGQFSGRCIYLRVDSSGLAKRYREYAGEGIAYSQAISLCADGTLLLAGATQNESLPGVHAYLLRVNQDGDTLWSRVYTNHDSLISEFSSVCATMDGGCVAAGRTAGQEGYDHCYVVKTDDKGFAGLEEREPAETRTTLETGAVLLCGDEIVATFELREYTKEMTLSLFDASGRRVRECTAGPLAAGTHTVKLSSADLAPGTYFVRLSTANSAATRRVCVLK